MKEQKMKQMMLRNGDEKTVVWLPADSRVRCGSRLTISADDYSETWTVMQVWNTQMDQEALHRQQHWNNNI